MLVIAPIFSRDVYSYAAQGEMVDAPHQPLHLRAVRRSARGRTPTSSTRSGGTSPPPTVRCSCRSTAGSSSSPGTARSGSVVGLRLLEVLAVALLAVSVPVLARGARLRPRPRVRAVPAQPARRAHARRRRAQRRAHGRAARRGPRARREASTRCWASSCARSPRRSRRPRRSASSTSPGSGSGRTCPCGMRLRPLAIAGIAHRRGPRRVHARRRGSASGWVNNLNTPGHRAELGGARDGPRDGRSPAIARRGSASTHRRPGDRDHPGARARRRRRAHRVAARSTRTGSAG